MHSLLTHNTHRMRSLRLATRDLLPLQARVPPIVHITKPAPPQRRLVLNQHDQIAPTLMALPAVAPIGVARTAAVGVKIVSAQLGALASRADGGAGLDQVKLGAGALVRDVGVVTADVVVGGVLGRGQGLIEADVALAEGPVGGTVLVAPADGDVAAVVVGAAGGVGGGLVGGRKGEDIGLLAGGLDAVGAGLPGSLCVQGRPEAVLGQVVILPKVAVESAEGVDVAAVEVAEEGVLEVCALGSPRAVEGARVGEPGGVAKLLQACGLEGRWRWRRGRRNTRTSMRTMAAAANCAGSSACVW